MAVVKAYRYLVRYSLGAVEGSIEIEATSEAAAREFAASELRRDFGSTAAIVAVDRVGGGPDPARYVIRDQEEEVA